MLKEEMVQSAISPMDYVAVRPGGRCEHVLGLLRVLYAHASDLELLRRTPDKKEVTMHSRQVFLHAWGVIGWLPYRIFRRAFDIDTLPAIPQCSMT